MQHLVAGPVVEHGDLLQRGQRHLVGRRVARSARRRARPTTGPSGSGVGSAGSAISGSMSSTSKTRSKLTSAVTTSRRAVAERGERRVEPVEQQRHRDDRAGVEVALQRRGSRRGRRSSAWASPDTSVERAEEHLHRHRRAHADVAAPARPAGRTRRPPRPGRPNSLTSVAPGAEKRSVICDVIAALCSAASRSSAPDPGADPAGRDHEHGQQHQRQQRDLPRQADHHGQREHEGDDVGDDARQRRGERPLGADDVVVEPADQGAGVGAGEERDRHALHVLEHPAAQVEDQALAEPGRLQPLEQPDAGVDDGDERR